MDPYILKNIVFGIEDSVISISGALLGIDAANLKNQEIVVSGFIVILVGALSMMYGSFVSDSVIADENTNLIKSSLVMFLSYFVVGLVLLSPFYLNLNNPSIFVLSYASIILSILLYNSTNKNIKKSINLFLLGMSLLLGSVYIGDKIKI